MQFNCPVCNKAGLPDYTAIEIVCPQCNSDLKPFKLLNSISKNKNSNYSLFFLIGIFSFVLLFGFLYLNAISEKKEIISSYSKQVEKFKDSLKILKSNIVEKSPDNLEINESKRDIIIQYKVRQNDCPSKIAKFFYNDWSMYKKIEKDNNLKQPYTLKVGQILSIKFKEN